MLAADNMSDGLVVASVGLYCLMAMQIKNTISTFYPLYITYKHQDVNKHTLSLFFSKPCTWTSSVLFKVCEKCCILVLKPVHFSCNMTRKAFTGIILKEPDTLLQYVLIPF